MNEIDEYNISTHLPKLYRVVTIEFSSLRMGLGDNLGVVFDVDTTVQRKVRRVLCGNGWKWSIVNAYHEAEWDYYVQTDQEVLDEIGEDTELIKLIP